MTKTKLDNSAMAQLFSEARTHANWQDKPVGEALLQEIYALAKFGPTSMNCSPMRVVFVKSEAAKARLKPVLADGNVDKTMAAPVCAIIAQDMTFYEKLPELQPHNASAKDYFAGNDDLIADTAFRNATLQGAYFIMAARALGLDCGPMSGFDNAALDAEFFAGTQTRSNFLCNLGYGDAEKLYPRSPRLSFDDACQIL